MLRTPSEKWGDQAEFRFEVGRRPASVGRVLEQSYEWELGKLMSQTHRSSEGSASYRAPDEPDEILMNAPLQVPAPDERDGAMLVALSCVLKLGAPDGCSACVTVTPNLCSVPRALADRTLLRTARVLNWVRVRLLFIGHREAPTSPSAAAGSAHDGAAMDVSDGAHDGAVPTTSAPVGCRFGLLDRDLLWLIAEHLVILDVNDTSCS
jgi:hypothetical protein